MGRVAGKVAFISGGGSGIGAGCGALLAREGAAVVLADLNLEAAERAAAGIVASGGSASALLLDAASEASWIAAMAEVRGRHGRLDIGVNCAGTQIARSFPTDTDFADWRHLMAVNLDGVFLGTKHELAAMMASDPVRGSIINISSIMGIVALPEIAAYNASKGGVRLYSKSVALSCAEKKIAVRVNTVHPGFIDTPLLRKALARYPNEEEGWAVYNALAPVGSVGEIDDVAYGVLYLASDEAKYVTGSELVIDGGYTAR